MQRAARLAAARLARTARGRSATGERDALVSALAAHRVALASASYRAAINPRNRDRGVVDGTGDYHLDDTTRWRLRRLSRDLERNSDLYDGLLSNWTKFLIGSGPRPVFASRDTAFNRAATNLFAEDAKAKRLDGRRLFAWPLWCAMLARCVARDGDLGVYHADDGAAVLLESERVTAVDLDVLGRVTGYRIANPAPGALGAAGVLDSGQPVPAWRLSLPAWYQRPSQTRGAPVLAAGLDDWDRLDSLSDAEITTAESAALPWMVIKHQSNSYAPHALTSGSPTAEAPAGHQTPAGWQRTDAGSILGLPPGLDGAPWAPERPNLDVPAFVRMALRHLCMPLLVYEVAFVDVGDLNYAAIRAVGRLANRQLDDFRTLVMEDPLSRVVRDWTRAQILAKRLPFVADFAVHTWDWDRIEIRDAEKDATATEREMANGTTTLQDVLGPQWRRTVDQRAVERDYLLGQGLPLPGKPAAPAGAPALPQAVTP